MVFSFSIFIIYLQSAVWDFFSFAFWNSTFPSDSPLSMIWKHQDSSKWKFLFIFSHFQADKTEGKEKLLQVPGRMSWFCVWTLILGAGCLKAPDSVPGEHCECVEVPQQLSLGALPAEYLVAKAQGCSAEDEQFPDCKPHKCHCSFATCKGDYTMVDRKAIFIGCQIGGTGCKVCNIHTWGQGGLPSTMSNFCCSQGGILQQLSSPGGMRQLSHRA